MKMWRIGINGFQENEANLIKALLRLLAIDHHFPWAYSAESPVDVCISNIAPQPSGTESNAAVIEITSVNHPNIQTKLHRPIDGPRLHACLDYLQAQMEAAESPLFKPRDAATYPSDTSAQPVLSQAVPHTKPADAERFKLLRWPPQVTLRENKERIRLSNLLVRKAMSVQELSTASGISADECKSFIAVLRSLQIVTVTEAVASKQNFSFSAAPEKSHIPSAVNRSLVSSIRRKLGLYLSPSP